MAVIEQQYDYLIADLLEEGKLKVYEDIEHRIYSKKKKQWLPETKILMRDERTGKYVRARLEANNNNYPRVRVAFKGEPKRFKLFAHRIVGVRFEGPSPGYEFDHLDGDRWNFNRWNLERVSSRSEQMLRVWRRRNGELICEEPPDEEKLESSRGTDFTEPTSYLDKPPNAPF